jgi:hypothetical protein
MLAIEFNDGCPTHVRKFCRPLSGSYAESVDESYLPGVMQELSFPLCFPAIHCLRDFVLGKLRISTAVPLYPKFSVVNRPFLLA